MSKAKPAHIMPPYTDNPLNSELTIFIGVGCFHISLYEEGLSRKLKNAEPVMPNMAQMITKSPTSSEVHSYFPPLKLSAGIHPSFSRLCSSLVMMYAATMKPEATIKP